MSILDGKTAIILGASGDNNMGSATARLFAEQGANIVLGARRVEGIRDLAEQLGAVAVQCDISNEADLSSIAQTAVDRFGRLDVAVNFAGTNVQESVLEMTREGLTAVSEVHFIGGALFIKNMAKAMKDGGSIITASSLTALVPTSGTAGYASSKKAIDHLVRVAAHELGEHNIRVNSIIPGFTRSNMTEAYFAIPTLEAAFKKEIPLGRLGVIEDIASAALWLASDGSRSTTGQAIDCTSGQSLRRTPTGAEIMGSA